MMIIKKFKTYYSFDKWYNYNNRKLIYSFPLIFMNMGVVEDKDNALYYKIVDKNRVVCLAIVTKYSGYSEDIEINLLETKEGYGGKGYGRAMLEYIIKDLKPKYITIYAVDENAMKFWHHMGFRKIKDSYYGEEMRKKVKKSEIL